MLVWYSGVLCVVFCSVCFVDVWLWCGVCGCFFLVCFGDVVLELMRDV